jgi:uncharacterized delta-60 repeat protein
MKKLYILIIALLILNGVNAQSGLLDSEFGTNGIVTTKVGGDNDQVTSVAIQTDGKIVVAGNVYKNAGPKYSFVVVRYTTNGILDTTFGTNGIATKPLICDSSEVSALAIQSDGKIVVVGNSAYGTGNIFTVRYKMNGTLDSTFGTNGTIATPFSLSISYAGGIAIQSNENLIVSGSASAFDANYDFKVAGYKPNGAIDSTFGTNGFNSTHGGIGCVMTLQTDDKIVIAGILTYGVNDDTVLVVRYENNGNLDSTFGSNGIVKTFIYGNNSVGAMTMQTDGKIVVTVNSFKNPILTHEVIRYNMDGTLDNTFGTNGMITAPLGRGDLVARAVAIQSNGKIVVAGSCEYLMQGIYHAGFAVLKYHTNGSLDSTFGTRGMVVTLEARGYAMALQTDEKIIVGGVLYNEKGINFAVARYLNNEQTGIQEELTDVFLSIYPNPFINIVTIETSLLTPESNLFIFNLNGQELLQQRMIANKTEIDLDKLSKGIYILKYTDNKVSVAKKIIKY